MATTLEYALLAGVAYRSTRSEINKFPAPQNWTEIPETYRRTDSTGFEAVAFQSGAQIVISYAGTGPGLTNIDWAANFDLAGLGGGGLPSQLKQAVEYYLQVRKANPNAVISLTGHSLGGGLAALVGVFFAEQAQTFDQAPFASAATSRSAELLAYLQGVYINGLRAYDDILLAPLSSFAQSLGSSLAFCHQR